MLWMIPLAALVVGVVYDIATTEVPAYATDDDAPPPPSTLERNLHRLRRELLDAGGPRVAVLGQPGAGKSSLLRALSDRQMQPLPQIGIHTDATNWADSDTVPLLSHWRGVRFADVPGYDTARHPVQTYLRHFPFGQFDALILVVNGKLHAADRAIFDACPAGKPLVVVRSFAESLDQPERQAALQDLARHLGRPAPTLLASNRSGEGLGALRQWLGL